jgi:dihydroneopterin triphosphate aldolase (PTPS-III) / 6-pyruvoyltetrahydropterin synthase
MKEKESEFELFLSRESFTFSASHFVARHGQRQRLHGHDYRVSVRLTGSHTIGSDGCFVDQAQVRHAIEKTCKELDERFLCPMNTNMIDITVAPGVAQRTVTLVCQDGSIFSFPKSDCALLPIVHTTPEEIAVYLWERIIEHVHVEYLLKNRIHTIQVNVIEGFGQETTFRSAIPRNHIPSLKPFDVTDYIREHDENRLPVPFVIREVTPRSNVSDIESPTTRKLAEV